MRTFRPLIHELINAAALALPCVVTVLLVDAETSVYLVAVTLAWALPTAHMLAYMMERSS